MALTSYAIAVGSNRRGRHGAPAATVRAAAAAIGATRLSRVRLTPALGPAGRGFANAVALVDSALDRRQAGEQLRRIEAAGDDRTRVGEGAAGQPDGRGAANSRKPVRADRGGGGAHRRRRGTMASAAVRAQSNRIKIRHRPP